MADLREGGTTGLLGRRRAPRRRRLVLLGVAVALVAFNLRTPVASVGPVLRELGGSLGMSGSGLALLTTVPVLCFGLVAPAAPRLARRFGIEPILMAMLLALGAGLVIRVMGGA